MPMTRVGSRRTSAAMAFLDPVRHRSNLTVRTNTMVNRLVFKGNHVAGVRLQDGTVLRVSRVVMCAGAIMTPCILQRSGISPKALLDLLSIPVVTDLPVGDSLADHPGFPLLAQPKSSAWKDSDFSLQTSARFSSEAHPSAVNLQLTCFSYLNAASPDPAVETQRRSLAGGTMNGVSYVASVACVLNKLLSTGNIYVTSKDPKSQPHMVPNTSPVLPTM